MISGTTYNKEFCELIIKDYGIGFSKNKITKIGATQQFNRVEKKQQGLGLGLFLNKIIIKKFKVFFVLVRKGRIYNKNITTIKNIEIKS
jgi:two-component system sensor histidine kinase/response regulator